MSTQPAVTARTDLDMAVRQSRGQRDLPNGAINGSDPPRFAVAAVDRPVAQAAGQGPIPSGRPVEAAGLRRSGYVRRSPDPRGPGCSLPSAFTGVLFAWREPAGRFG